jgi:hypothetical protein
MNIVSFGGGVQSTALAILAVQKKIEVDALVFCDTGFEQSIVFEFLNTHTLPLLASAGIPFHIAKARDYAGKYFANMNLPPFFNIDNGEVGREPAFCSHKWKKDVFTRYLNAHFRAKNYRVMMGFSTDEKHRAARMKSTKKYQYQFPLLGLQMRRGDCMALVQRTFNAPPPRSSCYFCPNHTREEWRDVMAGNDRERTIAFDQSLRKIGRYLSHDCVPIENADFDDKNESIFSRLCAVGCFL